MIDSIEYRPEPPAKTTMINGEFPFDEIKDENGDYFLRLSDAMKFAPECMIWSLVEQGEMDSLDDPLIYIYGPPHHHHIDVIGYLITEEPHDFYTYYFETIC